MTIFTTVDLALYAVGAFILLAWIIFFFAGLKHASLFAALDEGDYPFKEIYFVGYAVLQMTKYKYQTKGDRKLRKELIVLYGEKYADYYLRVIHSQKVTMAFTLATLVIPVYGLANDVLMVPLMIPFVAVAYYYFGTVTTKKILKRSESMLSDFSDVVSKLALLTNAGMIMREAWEQVAYTGDTVIYQEMQKAVY